MKNQRGLAISGLLFWSFLIALVAVLGIKVAPDYLTYFKILKATKAVAVNSAGKTVPEIRASFSKYMEVEHVSTITPADLDISKEGNDVVIAFSYEKRIPIFYNISLLIDFQGSTSGRD
ncbi:DUF4845 domain-containing protein [Propionivibrio sp.]|uniref:DUF4845 domain-containing protein n=1 Tax=Propionivibrio sp. TaxID=2212460 RepID=UPI00260992FB|nr:DUF4845 domain-containing protein [Propionivibrio sp.]